MLESAAATWILGIVVTLGLLAVFIWLYTYQRGEGRDDLSGVVGCRAVAQETFTQEGLVLVRGELWRATSDGGIIHKGASVEVQELRPGLVLLVHLVEE